VGRDLLVRLWRWLQLHERDEHYLAAAHDLADLERRQRILERQSGGPQFVTFNH
jgi:hypothetical protein